MLGIVWNFVARYSSVLERLGAATREAQAQAWVSFSSAASCPV